MTANSTCSFGNTNFHLTSSNDVVDYLKTVFPCTSESLPGISFYIATKPVERDQIKKHFYEKVGIHSRSVVPFENDRATFLIYIGEEICVYAQMKKSRRMNIALLLPEISQRWSNKAYLSASELALGHIVYSVILWVIFIHAVRNGNVILHASAFSDGARTFALSGSGGVGKTSLSGWALLEGGYSFVSDDLLPVADRQAFQTGLFVHIYPYNGFADRIWLGRDRTLSLSHLHWHVWKRWFGPKGACRRRLPSEVYGATALSSRHQPLSALIWLSPNRNYHESHFEPTDPESFVQDHLAVLEDEMRHAFDFFDSLGANSKEFITGGDFRAKVVSALLNSLDDTDVFQYRTSKHKTVSENGQKLKDYLRELYG